MAAAVPTPAPDVDPFHKPSRFAALRATLRASRPNGVWLGIFGAVVAFAFGGGLLTGRALTPAPGTASTPSATPPKPREGTPTPQPATNTDAPKKEPAEEPRRPESGKGTKAPFNAKLAKAAIDRAAARAKGCRDAGDAPGSASTTITFAPSGKVSEATVTTPRYASSKTGKCIVGKLNDARVPEFSGNPVTLKKSVTLK